MNFNLQSWYAASTRDWSFSGDTHTGTWDCPSCGQRASVHSPDSETLHESAERAGLLWIGEGEPKPDKGFAGRYLCALCSVNPEVLDYVAALRVAEALQP